VRYNIFRPAMVVSTALIATLFGMVFILGSETAHEIPLLEKALHEIGFAIIVAVVIWLVFERLSRGFQSKSASSSIRRRLVHSRRDQSRWATSVQMKSMEKRR
jgi:hypothetical protein